MEDALEGKQNRAVSGVEDSLEGEQNRAVSSGEDSPGGGQNRTVSGRDNGSASYDMFECSVAVRQVR